MCILRLLANKYTELSTLKETSPKYPLMDSYNLSHLKQSLKLHKPAITLLATRGSRKQVEDTN